MEKDIIKTKTDLSFGEYTDVEDFARRIKLLMRGGDKLSNSEAMALAQFSVVTRLNPFIGECWYIPKSGPMIGIAGARRLDQERAAEKNGYSFPVVTSCDPDEAGALDPKNVVAAFKTEINDTGATMEYQKYFVATLQAMKEAGAPDPFAAAKEVCGPRPSWVGYGYSEKNESSRMNKTQLARKRSEADALKKRIVIPFGGSVAESELSPEYDADAVVEDVQPKRTKGQIMSELGFGEDVDRDYPKETQPRTLTYDEAKQVIIKTSKGELFVGQLNKEQLDAVIERSHDTAHIEAAKIVLAQDFGMTADQEQLL